jgi:hypothetical protein
MRALLSLFLIGSLAIADSAKAPADAKMKAPAAQEALSGKPAKAAAPRDEPKKEMAKAEKPAAKPAVKKPVPKPVVAKAPAPKSEPKKEMVKAEKPGAKKPVPKPAVAKAPAPKSELKKEMAKAEKPAAKPEAKKTAPKPVVAKAPAPKPEPKKEMAKAEKPATKPEAKKPAPKPAVAKAQTPKPEPKKEMAKPTVAKAAAPKGPSSSPFRVFPERIALDGKTDRQHVVVQTLHAHGITRDETATATFTFTNPKLVKRHGQILRPLADGETTLTVAMNGHSQQIPVVVQNAGAARPVSFRLDVEPTFMRAGCNTGACHGSARGQDGFHLSLFGYDPDGDYHRLTREMVGRRIDLAFPARSLLLEKSTGTVSHTGGELFKPDSEYHAIILDWIKGGAKNDKADTPEVTGIRLSPTKFVFRQADKPAKHQAMLVATYSDGSQRDVTHLGVYSSNNELTCALAEDGTVSAGKPGSAFLFARFDKFTVAAESIVLPNREFEWPKIAEHNYIDTLVHNKLKKLQVLPSQLCSDRNFLRRTHLDLVGRLPSPEDYRGFLADENPRKRAALVDRLLEDDGFVDIWTMKWGELLQIAEGKQAANTTRPRKAVFKYYNYIRDHVAKNTPIDRLVRALMTGTGSNLATPEANFYTSGERLTSQKLSENVAQQFLGVRIQCAQCHNHPFDRWTMDDYYAFTGFFEGISHKSAPDARERYVKFNGKIGSNHPVYKKTVPVKFLGGRAPDVGKKDPRPIVAEWMTSKENTMFAQNFANRAWAHFMGRGIVEPVDDIRISNPPVNKELFDELGNKLVEYDYDIKKLIRDIANSRTYQLSSRTNESNKLDNTHFSHAAVRRIQAEVMMDAIGQATERPTQVAGYPLGLRATQLFQGGYNDAFLKTFGAASRDTVCACEVKKEPTLSQALELINGGYISARVTASTVIKSLLAEKRSPEEIISTLYVRCLAREPTEKELKIMRGLVGDATADVAVYNDVFWSLLNSTEFAFNH